MEKKKTALVTGGTSGVGLSIVKALIKENFYVFFIGSNLKKGKELELKFNAAGSTCTFICLDLSKLQTVYQFANDFKRRPSQLDLLVNVAGVLLPKREITPEGFEKTFAVGYLSSFILSLELADLLKKSEAARVVNVSAQAKAVLNIKLDFDNLDFSKNYKGFKTSLLTVHAKTVLTELLATKFAADGIDVNSFHPGIVRSEVTRNLPVAMRILTTIFSPLMSKDCTNGIYVSASPMLKGSTGNLYANKKPVTLNFDKVYKETLWIKTIELTEQFKRNIHADS